MKGAIIVYLARDHLEPLIYIKNYKSLCGAKYCRNGSVSFCVKYFFKSWVFSIVYIRVSSESFQWTKTFTELVSYMYLFVCCIAIGFHSTLHSQYTWWNTLACIFSLKPRDKSKVMFLNCVFHMPALSNDDLCWYKRECEFVLAITLIACVCQIQEVNNILMMHFRRIKGEIFIRDCYSK